jgi:nicotinamidase-related amidase
MSTALLVVDMQNGFVNHNSEHIIPNVVRLIEAPNWAAVIFTRFVNQPESGYVKWIGWSRFMNSPEIDIIEPLRQYASISVDKGGYSALVPDVAELLRRRSVERIVICGVATDGCVLKTAVDAFEQDIEPIVVVDACASHAGLSVHEAALLLLPRFIGRGQLRTTEDVVAALQ